jgi:hypothetical protein
MHTLTHSRLHRQTERIETSLRIAFATAGSLILSILTILILFFVVFLERTK